MVVRLAQSDGEMFPFLYVNERTGRHEGIFHEVWQMFSAYLHEEMLILGADNGLSFAHEDFPDSSGRYVGVIGVVQNGTADATIEDFMIDREKLRLFHLTLPFVTMTMTGLFTRVRQTEAWPIDAFIVFPYKIAALIVALGIVVSLIECATKWMRIRANPRKSGKRPLWHGMSRLEISALNVSLRVASFIFLLYNFMIFLMYNSAFAGTASSIAEQKTLTIEEVTNAARSDNLLMVSNGNFFGNRLPELFGYPITIGEAPGRAEIIPDMQTMADILCDTSTTKIVTTYIILYSIFSVNPAHPHHLSCALEPVDVSDRAYLKQNLPGFYDVNVNVPYPAVFYLNRARFYRSTIDRFNQIVQAMFDLDKQESLWWRRFTGRSRETFSKREPKSAFAYSPLPLAALAIVIYFCIGLIVASFVAFALELTPLYAKVHRRMESYARFFN